MPRIYYSDNYITRRNNACKFADINSFIPRSERLIGLKLDDLFEGKNSYGQVAALRKNCLEFMTLVTPKRFINTASYDVIIRVLHICAAIFGQEPTVKQTKNAPRP